MFEHSGGKEIAPRSMREKALSPIRFNVDGNLTDLSFELRKAARPIVSRPSFKTMLSKSDSPPGAISNFPDRRRENYDFLYNCVTIIDIINGAYI